MSDGPEARLAELGLELPEPFGPAATSTPTVRVGDLLFVSGQGPVSTARSGVCVEIEGAVQLRP